MLLWTEKSMSTPVVFGEMRQEREKLVPAFRVVLRLRLKVNGSGAGTVYETQDWW